MENIAPLQASGDSQCYRCRYWDWAVLFAGADNAWQHICTNPAEFTPGDDVRKCIGFTGIE